MYKNQPVILISGDGGSGKDTAAECFASHGPFKYVCSTSYVAAQKMWHLNQSPVPYASLAGLYNDRHNHRWWWSNWIDQYNKSCLHGDSLYLDALEMGNTILTGIRKRCELRAFLQLNVVDLIIWIDKPGIDRDPTQEYGAERADVIIRNEGTLQAFKNRCQILAKCFFGVEKAAG